jgi:hypothetical protein
MVESKSAASMSVCALTPSASTAEFFNTIGAKRTFEVMTRKLVLDLAGSATCFPSYSSGGGKIGPFLG